MQKIISVIFFFCFAFFGRAQTNSNFITDSVKPEEGLRAFYQHIIDNIKYPQSAVDAQIEGKVILELTINKYGKLDNVKVVRSLSPDCDKEAKRVVESYSKKWINRNGRNVVKIIPITFRQDF